jgi:RimJ/RimL family protein N-acetyltransferase
MRRPAAAADTSPGGCTIEALPRVPLIEIDARRIALRPFAPADAAEVFDAITPALTRFMAWEPPASTDAFAAVWRTWLQAMDEGTDFHFVARRVRDGRFLGLVGVHAARSECPELGVWMREDAHGRGYGAGAVEGVVDWAVRVLRPNGFAYPVAERNAASRRIAERLGGRIVMRRSEPKYEALVYRIPASPRAG